MQGLGVASAIRVRLSDLLYNIPDRDHLAPSEGRVFLRASDPLLPGSALHIPLGPLLIRIQLTHLSKALSDDSNFIEDIELLKGGRRLHLLSLFYAGVGVCMVWGELHLLRCPSQAAESAQIPVAFPRISESAQPLLSDEERAFIYPVILRF